MSVPFEKCLTFAAQLMTVLMSLSINLSNDSRFVTSPLITVTLSGYLSFRLSSSSNSRLSSFCFRQDYCSCHESCSKPCRYTCEEVRRECVLRGNRQSLSEEHCRVLKLTVFECINIILFKNFIDICIIVVRKIFKVVFG